FRTLFSTALLITFTFSCAQTDQEVKIEINKLTDNVYMLVGQGGNIGLSVGEDGVFIIDDQYPHMSPKIIDAIRTLSNKPIKFLANTHHHGDHSGGNANFQKEGAIILAHDNVRNRLKEATNRDGSKNPEEALPIITFNDKMSLYINGEQVLIRHIDNSHTDGDAILYFTESNVMHTGDTYFNGMYPYIDLSSGGSVEGYIEAVKSSLMLIDDETKIIPGHGSVSNKKEYKAFLAMMEGLREIIQAEISKGKTEEQVVNDANLTQVYDDQGYSWRFINSERIRKIYYNSLKK
ncbi:MAG: MBL fold metallo-hydrolase, partial [Flavobacteriaceae bacterium]|nr:MBL fold metallo-hydrolase [Flavobacteriaceae bacterium]